MKKSALALAVTVGLMGLTPLASASTSCYFRTVKINDNAGAEAPSWRTGHTHYDGWIYKGDNHHYVRYSYWSNWKKKRRYVFYADNNAGRDGDTWDTYYGGRYC